MRAVVQRVSKASVSMNGNAAKLMGMGLVVLLGIEHEDNQDDVDWLSNKVLGLRVFSDEAGKMNDSLKDINGSVMIISQFTLHASTRKGNRPSYMRAAKPIHAIPLYQSFITGIRKDAPGEVLTGEFGAHMKIELVNDEPVTILIDSKIRE